MDNFTLNKLEKQLMRHEGFRSKPYLCTAGKMTIGYGRNIEDVGISKHLASLMLKEDISIALGEVTRLVSEQAWVKMGRNRNAVLVNMCFNLGVSRLARFKKMLAALEAGDYPVAALEMMSSRWADQVGDRARELRDVMLKGEMPD